jgi:hypothetical protein
MLHAVGRHVRNQLVGYIALFVALGGVSYAALKLPANSVRSRQISNGQVKNADLAHNAVTSTKVKNGSLLSADFKAGQLPAGAQGPKGDTGPAGTNGQTGLQGVPGTARAYGSISSTGVIDQARSKNIVSVDHVGGGGLYCVTLAAGIDPATTSPVATVNANNEAHQNSDVAIGPAGVGSCTADTHIAVAVSYPTVSEPTDGAPALNQFAGEAGFLIVVP